MQRKRDFPLHRQLVDRRALRRIQPVFGDALPPRLGLYLGIVRVEEHIELCLIQILLIRHRGRFADAVGVIQNDAQVADAPDAGLRADGRLAGLDARIAEGALFGLAGFPVVVDLLVRATGHAHAPAAAFLLVDQHDAVFLALVDRAGGAGSHARRVQTMLADTRQIKHEGVFKDRLNLLLHAVEADVAGTVLELAAQIVFPVGPPFHLVHLLAGHHRQRLGRRRGGRFRRPLQVPVIEGKRIVVVVDLGKVGIGEDAGQDAPARALARLDPAVGLASPAAFPLLLILPLLRITNAGLGLDVVEPHVLHALARGPHVLAGHRAGVTTDALVEVHHHRDLRAYLHDDISSPAATGPDSSTVQGTRSSRRTSTISSRLEPIVP